MRRIRVLSVLVAVAGCGNTKANPADGPMGPDGSGGADASSIDALDLPDAPPGMGTIALTRSGGGGGTVRSSPAGIDCGSVCAATFPLDDLVTLTPTADPDAVFAGWSGGGCAGTGDCVVTVDGLVQVEFTFLAVYPLTVTRTGNGNANGAVGSAPGGIMCGTDCSETYDEGTLVQLTPSALTGTTFAGWSGGGGCTGVGLCILTMTAPTDVTATFTLDQYALTVTKAGAGTGNVTSTPPGVDCGTDCNETYDHGTMVTLTASASGFSLFNGWSGACTGTATTCTVTMTAARNVTATFAVQTFTLDVSVIDAQGLNALHVTSNTGGIDCFDLGGVCSATYNGGATVILTSHIPANETFNGWLGACASQGPTCTLTMNADLSTTLRTVCNGPCV